MSAQIWRTHVVLCDAPKCMAQLRSDLLDLAPDMTTTATVRKIARRRGWKVSVPGPYGRQRLDFCPEHRTYATPGGIL